MSTVSTEEPRSGASGSAESGHPQQNPAIPLIEALRVLREEWTERLDRELTGRLREGFVRARDEHRAAMEAAGLQPPPPPAATPEPEDGPPEDPENGLSDDAEDDSGDDVGPESRAGREEDGPGEAPPEDGASKPAGIDGSPARPPAPSFDALRSYRVAMHADVVRPILQLLNEVDPGRRTATLMDQLQDGMLGVAHDAPAVVRRPAPPDQYRASGEDGPVRTVLKSFFRAGRGAADVFRSSPPEQTLALRSIATSALQQDEVQGSSALTESLYQYHALSLHRVELALARWMKDWIPLESSGHDAESHLDPDERERLGDLREQLRAATVEAGAESAPPTGDDGTPEAAPAAGHAEPPPEEAPPETALAENADPHAVAGRLQAALDEVAEVPPPESFLEGLGARFERIEKRLEARVREGGTAFARTVGTSPRETGRSRRRRTARREEWREWFDAAIDRVRLTDEFLTLRADAGSILNELYGTTLADSVFFLAERVQASQEGLRRLRHRAPEADPEAEDDDPEVAEAMASDTWLIEEEARKLLDERLLTPLQERNPRARVEKAASDAVDALGDRLRELPRSVSVHPVRAHDGAIDPDQPIRTIPLREVARQGLDVLHLEGLRTTPAPLLDYLTRVEGECREVVEMVAYSLKSAREALLAQSTVPEVETIDPDAPPPPDSDETEESIDSDKTGMVAAQTLSVEGLERAAESLQVILAPAITAWDGFAEAAHETLKEGREDMYRRLVVEGTVQEQLRDVRSLVRSWWRGSLDRARALQRQYAPPLRRRAMRLYIRGLRLLRKGQSAMGATDDRKTESAADVLGRIPELLEPLPLIYRRLYSFQPLDEPGLMVGREDDRLWITSEYSRWLGGSCPPVVLTGSMAVGHTSFLNVLARELAGDDGAVSVVRLALATRYLEETALASRLARALWGEDADKLLEENGKEGNSALTGDGAPGWTFSRLEAVLRGRSEQRIVLLERLEHTMLRVPGGCVFAERFLAFQSRTAERIFWVNSVSDPAWKLLTTTEPHAYGLVQVRRLATPDRKTMEELLLVRHRRSGVPIEFTDPPDPNPLLARRLKRARNEKDRQEILRTDFFDWLFRASQENVLMAILLWLRSADFTSRPGWLRMRPSRAIRFAFLEEMDLPTSFALKAFLEHESLTLAEYARIFAVGQDEAFQALEILRRKVLIDRLDTTSGLPAPVRRLEEGVRYRIPPIITQVIAQNLRGQNILH